MALAQEGDVALLAGIDGLAAAKCGDPVVVYHPPRRIEVPARRVGPVVANQIWIAFDRRAHLTNRATGGAGISAENVRITRLRREVWDPGGIGIREERHAIAKFGWMMISCGIEPPFVQIRGNFFGERDSPLAALVVEAGHRAGVNYSQRNERTAVWRNEHPAAVALRDLKHRTRLSSFVSVHRSAVSFSARRARASCRHRPVSEPPKLRTRIVALWSPPTFAIVQSGFYAGFAR